MKPAAPVSVSVIVPTIGRPESLRRLLESILIQTVQPLEVVVADGSKDQTTEELLADSKWSAQGLRVKRVPVSPPHAVRQRHAAVAQASGEFFFFLDDDIVLKPDCLQNLLEAFKGRPEAVAAMGTYTNQGWPRPTTVWRWYLRWGCGLREEQWQGRVLGPLLRFGFEPVPKEVRFCDWIGSGNSLIRRSGFLAVGGFSDFFLHRCTMNEDVDLSLKLAKQGPILFCPTARMEHFHAPGGRLPPDQVAEDDLYNRFLILHHTQHLVRTKAFGQVLAYFLLETAGNTAGALRRRKASGLWPLFVGRWRAVRRIAATFF